MSIARIERYGLPFSNVAANNPSTGNVSPGKTVEAIRLALGGTAFTKAMISNYKMRANGKPIIDVASGTDLEKINAYRGEPTDAAYLDVHFSDYSLNNEFDRHVGAFDTSLGIESITHEMDIGAATAPTLKQILWESGAQKDRSGNAAPFAPLIHKLLRYPFAQATAGQLPFTVPFGRQNGAIIKRVHIMHGGNMTAALVRENGLTLHESTATENAAMLTKFKRTPQANMYTIDFVKDGDIRKALDTRDSNSLEWLFTFSAADSGRVYVEYLDVLGNL